MKIKQMAERLNSVPVRKKAKQLLLAVTLAVLMVNPVTSYGVAAHAKESGTITAFAELSGEIASQQLAVGAEESAITLPDTLSVTLSVYSTDTAESTVEESQTAETPAEEPQEDENNVDIDDADTEQTETEEITSQERTLTGITWQINAERSGSDTFDSANVGAVFFYEPVLPEGYTLADGVSLPQIQVQIEDNGKWAFSQSQTIDGIEITVKAEKDVFPEGAVLHAKKVTGADDKEKIEDAVSKEVKAEDTTKTVTELVSFDITITDADGNELQPDTSKGEVKVSFAQLPMVTEDAAPTQELKVFHMDDSLNEAKGLDTTVNQEAGTLEAPAEHFTVYTAALLASQPSFYTYDISEGAITITSGTNSNTLKVSYGAGLSTDNIPASQAITITGTINGTKNAVDIEGVTATLVLSDLSITTQEDWSWGCPISLSGGANVTLKLSGTNTLYSSKSGAGIRVPEGTSLTITSENGDGEMDGTLNATARGNAVNASAGYFYDGAGIGAEGGTGAYAEAIKTVGTILIKGGTINATGGYGGAGIGGSIKGTTGSITISGGKVTAASPAYKNGVAGIGGGFAGYVPTINITGGEVYAVGRYKGAGIGGGYGADNCGNISISGGKISATSGGYDAASIGYGCDSTKTGGSVTITGGDINLNGGTINPEATNGTHTLKQYNLKLTIYDGKLTESIQNGTVTINEKAYPVDINVAEKCVGTVSLPVLIPETITGDRNLSLTAGSYSYTATVNLSGTGGDVPVTIGEKLYPVYLWFYDAGITSNIDGAAYEMKRNGVALAEGSDGTMPYMTDGKIVKTADATGKMTMYMTGGEKTEISVTTSSLNGGTAMSVTDQTIKQNADGTSIIMFDSICTEQLTEALDLSNGNITFEHDASFGLTVTYSTSSGEKSVNRQNYQNEFRIIQSNKETATKNHITVKNTSNFVNINLDGVNMQTPSWKVAPIALYSAKVNLYLLGENKVDCSTAFSSAVNVDGGSEIVFDGTGSIEVVAASSSNAGIGGQSQGTTGKITINGGTIISRGNAGAAIGSGSDGQGGESSIYINGGTVKAYSSTDAGAAIGGGYGTRPSNVYITGGTVYAESTNKGAAIGGGNKSQSGGEVVISGGYIEAKTTTDNIPAIGSGFHASNVSICPSITISGGTLKLTGAGTNGVEIGCGSSYTSYPDGKGLIITGGTIFKGSNGQPRIGGKAPTNGTSNVYYTKADVSAIYGTSATVTSASITDNTYGFNDVKTDGSGILHLFLPASAENTKTTADFNGVTYGGTVTSTAPNILKLNIPLEVSKGTVTGTSATLNVTADSGNTIYYVASSTPLSEGSAVEAAAGVKSITMSDTTKTISLSNLTEGTAYTYYLTAKEGGNYSDVVAVTFTTLLAAPNVSDVSVDYNGELLKADSGLGYTLEYALSANAASWTEVTTAGTSLTAVLNNHTGTEAISLYIRKNLSGVLSEAVSVTIPARPDCSVNTMSIDYLSETVMIPSSVLYQFATSVPASWDSAEAGTDSAVSLTDKIAVAGTTEASLYKIYFRNPATSSSFVSKTASAVIPARPQTPAAPSTASVADTSVTLTAVTGAEYSKDGTNWQDSTVFSALAFNASQAFYQRIKATESSFASASSSAAITTAKKSIAGATVTLTACDSFTYDGTEKTPTVTVTLNSIKLDSSQYTVNYSNSNGGAGNHTSAGTVTVTVTASSGGNYSGAVSQTTGMTYTIAKAPLTVAAATTAGRPYNGTKQVSITGVTLSGIVPADNGKVSVDTSNLTGMLSDADADAGTYNSVTLTTAMTLTGTAAGNYLLTQPTAAVSSLVPITKADALSLMGTATMVKLQANYKIELDLTQISGYPVNPGATPVFAVTSDNTYKGLASAMVNASGKLTLIADNTANSNADTVTVSVTGMGNFADSTITVTVNYTDKTPVTISGVTAQNGTYNGVTHIGYTGTPSSSYIGTYEITYTGRNGTTYNSATAPVNAGDYTVNFKVPDSNATYAGSVSISFEIAKATITAIADNKSMTTGGSLPSFTVRYTGIATGDSANSIFTTPATPTITADGKTAGSYTITVTDPVLMTDAANNYTIGTVVNGTLTVSTPSSGDGSSSGGGTSSGGSTGGGSTTTPTTPTTTPEKKPNQPVTAVASVTATAGTNGTASASIPDKAVTDAIAKAQSDATSQGKTANGISAALNVTVPKGTASLTATLTRSSLDSLVSAGVSNLEINGSLVKVSFDKKVLAEIQKQSSGNINMAIAPKTNLSDAAKKLIGTRPVYDITVGYESGKSVSSFGGGVATVSIPYALGKNEAVGGLYAVYVDAKGNATRIAGSAYDANSGCVIFTTTHFSQYGIGYTAPAAKFTDISSHWAKESIDYVVGRGLLSGTSETSFSPNSAMLRGMLVTALGRLTGVDTKAYTGNSFTDVNADSAYRPYIEWAYSKGIIQGIGGSQFAPDRAITREEIAVIFANYAKATGYTLPITREATTYADTSSIGSSYKYAVKAMQQAGIMMGVSDNKFNPKGNATRAEVSTMLNRFISNLPSTLTAGR